MNDTFIHVAALSKVYKMGEVELRALSNLNLDIAPNQFCLIMGPSGSGKSTLLNLIGGLDRPTAGKILVGSQSIDELDENKLALYRRKKVGFIFQSFNLIPSMSALENVAFPLRFSGASRRHRRQLAMELLERVHLEDWATHKPTELSGGQQQRVAIARALINQPQLILADEPTGNLDTASGDSIMQLLVDLHREGATIIVVSHDHRIIHFASQVVHILDGRTHEPEPTGISPIPN